VQTGVRTGVVQEEDLIHIVWPNPSNSFFSFFNVCTYRSAELIVAPFSNNPTTEIPSLFQKTLSMVLPHISPHTDFFWGVATTHDAIPLIVSSSMGSNG
jgi:hypothetical protein